MKKIFLFLIGLYTCSCLNAQGIEQVAENYFADHTGEKIYLHLARPYALAGESLYFRIFHVTSGNLQPDPLSKIAYVELFDANNNPVSQVRVRMDSAGGWGYIELPPGIDAGRYVVRAYTQWMRNGSEKLFFHAPVTVINTFKRLGLKAPDDTPVVSLFPEGGNFVYGLSSRTGLMLRTRSGDPITSEFKLLSGDSLIGEYATDELGLAILEMRPDENNETSIVVNSDTLSVGLPGGRDEGITMKVTREGANYNVDFQSAQNNDGAQATLAVFARERLVFHLQKSWQGSKLSFLIPDDVMLAGVNQLTLLNQDLEARCERLVFVRPETDLSIDINGHRETFNARDDFSASIRVADAGSAIPADLSVSVYMWDSLFEDPGIDIASYFNLTSELNGLRHLPEGYLGKDGNIEKLLLTYGWRRYDWTAIRENAPLAFLPEFRQPVIRGYAGGPGVMLFAGMPESSEKLFITESDKDGRFSFELPNVGDNTRMILTSGSDLNLDIEDPFDNRLPEEIKETFAVSGRLEATLRQANVNLQVKKHFYDNTGTDSDPGNPFYGAPDVSYRLDDFTRFPVMEEVFREYVYGVYVRKRSGEFNRTCF
ncbi:MAG: hypothetical protein P8X57_11395 [Cyclobacteriaceae bacterium]